MSGGRSPIPTHASLPAIYFYFQPETREAVVEPHARLWEVNNFFLDPAARAPFVEPRARLCGRNIFFICSPRRAWRSSIPARASAEIFFYFQPETLFDPHARLCDSVILFEPVRRAEFIDPHSCLRDVNILFISARDARGVRSIPTRASAAAIVKTMTYYFYY